VSPKKWIRFLVPSRPFAVITDEGWVRRQLERRGGTFTCRLGVAGQCWNPGQRVPSNPIIGPADVTYTLHYNGQVTAKVDRLD